MHVETAGGLAALLITRFGLLLTIKMTLAIGFFSVFATAPFVVMHGAAGCGFGARLRHFGFVTGDETSFRCYRFDGMHWLAFSLAPGIVILAKTMYFA